MQAILIMFHVLIAISIICLVLLQHGKGADMGAGFGAGASQTMFGSVGVTPFLVKITAIFAAIFFATSIAISFYVAHLQSKQMAPGFSREQPSVPRNEPLESLPVQDQSKT